MWVPINTTASSSAECVCKPGFGTGEEGGCMSLKSLLHVDLSQQEVQAEGIMTSVFAEATAQVLLLGRLHITLCMCAELVIVTL
jgi:hypothetical protein